MPDTATLLAFATASFILICIPGPAVLFIIAKSSEHGRKAGLVSVAGIQLGALVHVAAAALGLSALLVASAAAFTALKYAGAIYLLWLGFRKIATRSKVAAAGKNSRPLSLWSVFVQGVIVNVLNPKAALFFFAFLPQFINPAKGAVAGQVAFFGLVFVAIACVSDSLYALAAGSLSRWIKGNPLYLKVQQYVTGVVYIGLGLLTLMVHPSQGKK